MTSYQEIFTRALHRIEKDADFFSYYNVESQAEVEQLVMEQLASYLPDAIDKIYERGVPEVDFYSAMDNELQEFTIDLTQREVGLISSLMFLVYLERQLALLGAFKLRMSPSDLNTFSSANERNSFKALVSEVRHECDIALSHYFSVDRLTNSYKTIDHSAYSYE